MSAADFHIGEVLKRIREVLQYPLHLLEVVAPSSFSSARTQAQVPKKLCHVPINSFLLFIFFLISEQTSL